MNEKEEFKILNEETPSKQFKLSLKGYLKKGKNKTQNGATSLTKNEEKETESFKIVFRKAIIKISKNN